MSFNSRRNYLSAAEEKVVLEVNDRMVRAGFSGEAAPLYCGEAEDDLPRQLQRLYSRELVVDRKSKRVAVVEGPMMSLESKQLLVQVLLQDMRCPQITLYPSEVTALISTGRRTGLVVATGCWTTVVVPVYESRSLAASSMVVSPMGSQRLQKQLRKRLREHARLELFDGTQTHVEEDVLTDGLVERIIGRLVVAGGEGQGVFRITVDQGRARLVVPRFVTEQISGELLEGDKAGDLLGIAEAVVRSIEKSPLDTRRQLVGSILVVGGLADIPGFSHQLMAEVKHRLNLGKWKALAKDANLLETGGCRASERSWVGASLAVAAKIGGQDINPGDPLLSLAKKI